MKHSKFIIESLPSSVCVCDYVSPLPIKIYSMCTRLKKIKNGKSKAIPDASNSQMVNSFIISIDFYLKPNLFL